MQATSVDMRYKTKQIFEALDRGEQVELLQRGKLKGRIIPASDKRKIKIQDNPYFGSEKNDKRSVAEIMKELRRPRYDAL
jgi:antitoxin (DNA-binding transcriptional repressor) of toxin-antitoxin stability system